MADEEKTAETTEETAAPAEAGEGTATSTAEAPAAEEQGTTDVELSKNAEKVLDMVKELPVLELANLVKAMEDVFGVSAAAPVAMMAGAAASGDDAAAEKSEFDVILTSPGGSKINVIKAVREITGLGLKEAKDIVDSAPKAVKEGVKKEEAEEIKAKLEEAGATCELQ